jgi:hypothetical protein
MLCMKTRIKKVPDGASNICTESHGCYNVPSVSVNIEI